MFTRLEKENLLQALTLSLLLAFACLTAGPATAAEEPASGPNIAVCGLAVHTVDVDQAVTFYGLYGFEVASRKSPDIATVKNGAAVIDLIKVPKKLNIDNLTVAHTHLNVKVENLDAALAELNTKTGPGYTVIKGRARMFSLGQFAPVKDPSGNFTHVIEPNSKPEGFKRGVFNVGINVIDMAKAREFYRDKLGFTIFSEDYFPPDLPLNKKGTLPLVLHERATKAAKTDYPNVAGTLIVLCTPEITPAMEQLKSRGVRFFQKAPQDSPLGRHAGFVDPFGIVFELREPAAAAAQ